MTDLDFQAIIHECKRALSKPFKGEPVIALEEYKVHLHDALVKLLPQNAIVELVPDGLRFPDITVKINDQSFGITVRETKHNSPFTCDDFLYKPYTPTDHVFIVYFVINEGILTKIMFGKLEDMVTGIEVVHTPRFQLAYNSKRRSIFRNMDPSFNEFMQMPVKDRIATLREFSKKKGKEGWFTFGDNVHPLSFEDFPVGVAANKLYAQTLAQFPQLHSAGFKYRTLGSYLLLKHGIMCSSLRDKYTSGGQKNVLCHGEKIRIKQISARLSEHLARVYAYLDQTHRSVLMETWSLWFSDEQLATLNEEFPLNNRRFWESLVLSCTADKKFMEHLFSDFQIGLAEYRYL